MKKYMLASVLLSSLLLGGSFVPQASLEAFADEASEHDDHDDHEVEVDKDSIIKREGDQYIIPHGDHYHKVPVSSFTQEEQEEIDQYLESNPDLAKAYDDQQNIYKGYFEDSQVKDRDLSDWEGEWQSVYPYLQDGTLDPVMEMRADKPDASMTAEEYKAYYQKGYQTSTEKVVIEDDKMTFTQDGKEYSGQYKYDGYKILTYEKGNRGVRFLFSKVSGDKEAPQSVQFSDHQIFPTDDVSHFHLYMGDMDHDKLAEELENWPTYYPQKWTGGEILADQLNH